MKEVRLRLGGWEAKDGPLDAMGVADDDSLSLSLSEPSSSTDWKEEVERVGLCLDGEAEGFRALGREGRGGGRPFDDADVLDRRMGEGPDPATDPVLEGRGLIGEKVIISLLGSGEPFGVAVWRKRMGCPP